MQYKFLISPWKMSSLKSLVRLKGTLHIITFVNVEGVNILSNSIQTNSDIEISLITNLTTQNIVNRISLIIYFSFCDAFYINPRHPQMNHIL